MIDAHQPPEVTVYAFYNQIFTHCNKRSGSILKHCRQSILNLNPGPKADRAAVFHKAAQ